MSQQELLKKIIENLRETEIDYMLTGSIASSMQGEPRSTHDFDIIIDFEKDDIKKFLKVFKSVEFYLDEEDVVKATENKKMFNMIDVKEGIKIDFWILTDEPFDKERFSRKYAQKFAGKRIWVSTPEDTILMKLRWAKLSGGSEKQFADALRVYEVQFQKLDLDYMESWIENLDIKSLWEKLKNEAEVI